MARVMRLTVLVVACLTIGVVAQPSWKPAKLRDATLPLIPVLAVSAGEVLVEVTVTEAGVVGDLTTLRTTPPFTQSILNAVRSWRFQPAEETIMTVAGDPRSIVTRPVQSKVMVAGVFRAPTLNVPTLGEPPKSVKAATEDVAAPLNTVMPQYPPRSLFDGAVLVQVTVDVQGRVVNATIMRSAAGFDESALSAARQWTFRPARIHGRAEQTFAYIVFAYRQPVT
jgi:TonB family protein